MSVNTEAKSRVTFYLLYEELLQRKRGIYEHVINLTPRQKLKDFGIDVMTLDKYLIFLVETVTQKKISFLIWGKCSYLHAAFKLLI